jgi:hypothetical protein
VVVAITCPLPLTAKKEPAAVPRADILRLVVLASVKYPVPALRAVVEAFVIVRREFDELNAKPDPPPERVAGVPEVEVQNGTCPEVSADEVAR